MSITISVKNKLNVGGGQMCTKAISNATLVGAVVVARRISDADDNDLPRMLYLSDRH